MAVSQSTIGVLTLSYEWQTLQVASGACLFKLNQIFGDKTPGNYLLIAQFFPDFDSYYGIRKVFPSREPVLLEMDSPQLFITEGLENRFLALKQSTYYRTQNVLPWTVTVNELYATP